MSQELTYPWDRTRVKLNSEGKLVLNSRQYEEIRKNIQLIETVLDGATQQKNVDLRRLSLALSTVRSIQSLYFPQLNYSLFYFKGDNKAGEQSLDRQNYHKYRKMKQIENHTKITEIIEILDKEDIEVENR